MKLTTRHELIDWLEDNAPLPRISRAISMGKTELLGGFTPIPPTGEGGWIITVESAFHQVYTVAIFPPTLGRRGMILGYRAIEIPVIPWENWVGDKSKNPMYRGDRPELYKEHKKNEIKKSH